MPEEFQVPELVVEACVLKLSYPAYMAYRWADLIAERVRLGDTAAEIIETSDISGKGRVVVALDISGAGKDPWHGSTHTVVVEYQDRGLVTVSMRMVLLKFLPVRIEYTDYLSMFGATSSNVNARNTKLGLQKVVFEEEGVRALLVQLEPFSSHLTNRVPPPPAVQG